MGEIIRCEECGIEMERTSPKHKYCKVCAYERVKRGNKEIRERKKREREAALAKEKNLRCTVGSDGHSTRSAGRTALVAKERIRTNEKLIEILKSGDYEFYIQEK